MNVSAIDTPAVIKFLTPIWKATPETASRLRGRIEKVLDWAGVHQFRDGPNPCAWKGNLEHVFTRNGSEHHKAMPFADVPAFVAGLRGRDSVAARALEFLILTAARFGEASGARWSEFDLAKATWTVPAERMKAGKEHTVPLSKRAVELLAAVRSGSVGDFVFAGQAGDKPITEAALRKMLENGYTIHGFRSAFRDWCSDATSFDRETAEHALAHTISNKTEAAYRRGSALNKRRLLMQSWADYLDGSAEGNVVKLHG